MLHKTTERRTDDLWEGGEENDNEDGNDEHHCSDAEERHHGVLDIFMPRSLVQRLRN